MISVSESHFGGFERSQVEAHPRRVEALLLELEPGLRRTLSGLQLRRLAEVIIDQARKVRFAAESEFRDFARFSILSGTQFLRDPQCGWANRLLLNSRGPIDGRTLSDAGLRAADRVTGPDGEHARAASGRALRELELIETRDFEAPTNPTELTASLNALWPEKADDVGAVRLERLTRAHLSRAAASGATVTS